MPTASTVLTEAIESGKTLELQVPGLRQGDIEIDSGKLSVGGFEQPPETRSFGVDFAYQRVFVTNTGPNPWAVGAAVTVTWEGLQIEPTVQDHETRITALEAGGGTGGGTDPALEARVTALETEVDNHKWQLVDHEGRISNNRRDITSLEARVAALEAKP